MEWNRMEWKISRWIVAGRTCLLSQILIFTCMCVYWVCGLGPTEKHLFHILAIIDNAAVNMGALLSLGE